MEMNREWEVWDMTNADEWVVNAEGIEDFTSQNALKTWVRIDSKYDMLEEKWYFYFREEETKRIFRVNLKEKKRI